MSNQALPSTAISTWLSRSEFLAVYGFMLAAWYYPSYGAQDMEMSDRDKFFENLGRALRWSIRRLMEFGCKFQGLELDARGELRPTVTEPVEPRNEVLLLKIAGGRMISPVVAIKEAIKFVEAHEAQLDKGPMIEVLIQCEKDSAEAIKWWEEDPETAKAAQEFYRDRLKSAGLKPLDEVN